MVPSHDEEYKRMLCLAFLGATMKPKAEIVSVCPCSLISAISRPLSKSLTYAASPTKRKKNPRERMRRGENCKR